MQIWDTRYRIAPRRVCNAIFFVSDNLKKYLRCIGGSFAPSLRHPSRGIHKVYHWLVRLDLKQNSSPLHPHILFSAVLWLAEMLLVSCDGEKP